MSGHTQSAAANRHITVVAKAKGRELSYQIEFPASTGAAEIDEIHKLAPAPTAKTNNSIVRFVSQYGKKPDGESWPESCVVKVMSGPAGGPVAGEYYELETYGSAIAMELAPAPSFKLVALDDTHVWTEEVQHEAGEIQGIYLYDENQHTYCAEITPSYGLHFMYNRSKNPVGRDDDQRHEFESEDGGAEFQYRHARVIDGIPERFKYASTTQADDETIEIYRCAPEHIRPALYDEILEQQREYLACNICFDGHFDREPEPIL